MDTKSKKLSTRQLCHIAIFVTLIAVMAQLTIPLPVIPLTLQTFAVPLAGAVLGAKKGAIAALVYLLLGAVGVPVFRSFTAGISLLLGPTGGYLLSFPIFAFIVGLGANTGKRVWLALALIVGSVINLFAGMIQLSFVNQLDMHTAFMAGVFPFIIPELLKLLLVFIIAPRLRQVLERNG